ncbi:MAG: UDP-N-acetyl-D-glucosamine 6-dehydrogenase [Firmicutes bacterium ADurb.Bin182]|nr:MAG: UDP-N-acetyl-D-glucosamine 6-dehydrogenase [Firmicutes bacterium ADurb.Bin182]
MDTKKDLLNKIINKTAVVAVIGLGYVGLPLAVEKAKAGYKTIGLDILADKVEMVNNGINYIGDIIDGELAGVVKSGSLRATADFSVIKEVDCAAICVPTPLDEHYQPDITHVVNSTKEIARYLHRGMLIVLESTTYPGTTEEVIKPVLEESGLKCGTDFFLAFSPERVDPGNKEYKTKNTPKVVGGVTKDCTEVAAALYRNILEGEVFEVSNPAIAEMEKILENTYRNINIALANEMAIVCDKMGISVWEVIEAAKTKPYGYAAFYPGPGVGGHCIPIDPFYLTWKARAFDYHTKLIETAGEINISMPMFVVDRSIRILNNSGIALNGARILLLGVAYKQDIDDYRESPVLKIIENLEKYGAIVSYNDPYIPEFHHKGKRYISTELTAQALKEADLVVITTMHSCYDYDFIHENSTRLFDTKNATRDLANRAKVELL